jgi:monomeric sarcosine oxidase
VPGPDVPLPRSAACVVIGTGVLGSSAAASLARRLGGDVVVLEQFEPGHRRGSSSDHSRIIRHSYHSPVYTRLTRAMFASWERAERASDTRLVVRTGGLDLGDPSIASSVADLEASAAAMTEAGIAYERLTADDVRRRWPQWTLADDVVALFQEDAGILDVGRACAAQLGIARALGAAVHARVPVLRLEDRGDEVDVHTGGGVIRAGHVVVCTGKWTAGLLAGLHPLPLRHTSEQVTYVASRDLAAFAPERFPIWIRQGDPCFYGFPVYGEPAVKIAQDLGGPEVEPDDEEGVVDPDRVTKVTDFLAEHLPGAAGPVLYSRSCLYDLTPDRDLVVGPLPGHPRILVTAGAGHAAKFGALFGDVLADLVCDGATAHPVEALDAGRPALR